jgi:hypothetical protein
MAGGGGGGGKGTGEKRTAASTRRGSPARTSLARVAPVRAALPESSSGPGACDPRGAPDPHAEGDDHAEPPGGTGKRFARPWPWDGLVGGCGRAPASGLVASCPWLNQVKLDQACARA